MTIKKFVFAFLFFNLVFINFSHSQKYNAIDSIVLKYPNFGTTEKLAERIQKDFTSEHDKARAIFSWMTFNINYDAEEFLNPSGPKIFTSKNNSEIDKQIQNYKNNSIKKTFRTKKGVCEDFSMLYQQIGTLTGLKVKIIHGDAKTLSNDIGRKRLYSNHAWNMVEIDGKWALVDVTWGEGYFDYDTKTADKKFKPFYFDMKPKYFYAQHYPESADSLDFKLNKEEYLNGPLIYNKMIEGDHEIILPRSGVIEANDGDKITFKIRNISQFDDLYYVVNEVERVNVENSKEENGVLEFQITYNRKIGRFITFFLYQSALATFKIVPK